MKSHRVVVVASEPQLRAEVKQVLNAIGFEVTGEAGNPEDGLRLTRRVQPDLVVLEPSGRCLALLDILGQEREIPVVVILAAQDQRLLDRVVETGAAGVVFRPFGVLELASVTLVALHNFSQIAQLQKKFRLLEEEIEVRKLVDRAKGKLMHEAGMSEKDAYRWLQKYSMDHQRSLKRVATDILKGRMELPEST